MALVAKMRCQQATKLANSRGEVYAFAVKLFAVYTNDPNDPNHVWSTANRER